MKTLIIKNCDEWRVAGDGMTPKARAAFSRHASRVTRHTLAFTIVELLTVIAIIAILAALLLPALSAAKIHAQKTQARLQAQDIVTAIQNYDSAYSRFPVSKGVQTAAGGDEFTYGGSVLAPFTPGTIPAIYTTNNSEVIAILMDYTNYPDGSGPTVNANYRKIRNKPFS